MKTPATLGELVEFVLFNRKDKVFRNYREITIADSILKTAKAGLLLYTKNDSNRVTGILLLKETKSNKTLHARNLLTIERNAIRQFAETIRKRWPNHQITAFRKDKFVRYNASKLLMKLTNQPKGEAI